MLQGIRPLWTDVAGNSTVVDRCCREFDRCGPMLQGIDRCCRELTDVAGKSTDVAGKSIDVAGNSTVADRCCKDLK